MVIEDKIALGTLAGITATIPQILVSFVSEKLGLAHYFAFQYSASIFVDKNLTFTLGGLILGGLVWESMAAGLGVLTAYLIAMTGRDFWWLKGLLIANTLMFIFLYGFYFGLEAPKLVSWDVESNLSIFIENLVFGLTVGYLAVRWGKFGRKMPVK